jgi:hypothetical protein
LKELCHIIQERQHKITSPLKLPFWYETNFFHLLSKLNNNGSFSTIFVEIFGGPFIPFKKFCPNHGQHFKGFLVGHNQKKLYIRGVEE